MTRAICVFVKHSPLQRIQIRYASTSWMLSRLPLTGQMCFSLHFSRNFVGVYLLSGFLPHTSCSFTQNEGQWDGWVSAGYLWQELLKEQGVSLLFRGWIPMNVLGRVLNLKFWEFCSYDVVRFGNNHYSRRSHLKLLYRSSPLGPHFAMAVFSHFVIHRINRKGSFEQLNCKSSVQNSKPWKNIV